MQQRACLWQESLMPDNHVDDDFLSSLVLKRDVAWSYWQIVAAASIVARQISIVGVVSAVTVHLYQGRLQPTTLLLFNFAGAAAFAAVTMGGQRTPRRAGLAVRRTALLIAGTYLLSPLLQTLTRTTSSDTVVAVAIYMLLLHLFLHDYRLRLSLTDKAAGAISLAAAVFASVLIASRLDSHLQVFSQVLLSLEVYLVLPYALHSVTDRYPAQSGVTTAVCSLVCGALLLFSPPILCLYVLVLCFVTFVCPIWLVGIQRRSAIPTGPWDVADINMDPPGM